MKGPIFVKDGKGGFELAECCKDCGFCSVEHQDCILPKCLFINVIEEDEENED